VAEIVNLRMARKRAARKAKEAVAEENRVLSSISGKQRRRDGAIRQIQDARHEGNRIERPEPGSQD
jgi:hypothetical protein